MVAITTVEEAIGQAVNKAPEIHSVIENETIKSQVRDELQRVSLEYNIPFDVTDVIVSETYTGLGYHHGTTVPFGCDFTATSEEWYVDGNPDGYVLLVNSEYPHNPSIEHTVRHELAHIINWHEHGYTTEDTGIHTEWLERLDAENPLPKL